MKRLLDIFLVLLAFLWLFTLTAKAQDTIQSTVCFQDSQGNCLANGALTLDLSQPARVTSGGGLVAPLRISVTLDSTGKIPANTKAYGNDQLTPSGTTYRMRVYNSNGLLASDVGTVIIQGASPVDLSQLTPVSVNPTVSTNAAITTANNAFTGNNTHSGTETFTNQIIGSQGSLLSPSSVGAFYNLTGNTFSGNAPDMQFSGTGAAATDNTATGTFLQIPLRSVAMTQASNNGRIFGGLIEYRHTVNDAGGDKVGLQFGTRSTVGAAVNNNLWGANGVFASKDAPGTGKFQILELDMSNSSGVDWTTTNSTGLSLVLGGNNKLGIGIDVNRFSGATGTWLTGLRVAQASNIGIDIQNNPTTTMNVGGGAVMQVNDGNAWVFTQAAGATNAAVIRITPNNDTAGAVLFGTNAANTVVNWQINKSGAAIFPTIGPNGTQQHTLPAVASDTVALLAATQTLTNKTCGSGNTGFVCVAGSANLTAQQANIAVTTLTTPTANGFYRASCIVELTQVATTSSTLPNCLITYTSADSSVGQTFTLSNSSTANLVGTVGVTTGIAFPSSFGFYAKSGGLIGYSTTAYASVGATPMQYAVHVRLEGPF